MSRKSENLTTLFNKYNDELKNNEETVNAFADHFANMSNLCDELGSTNFSKKVINKAAKISKLKPDMNKIIFVKYSEVINAIKELKK